MQRCMHRRAKSSRCHGRGEYNYCDSLRASLHRGNGPFHVVRSKEYPRDLINDNGP